MNICCIDFRCRRRFCQQAFPAAQGQVGTDRQSATTADLMRVAIFCAPMLFFKYGESMTDGRKKLEWVRSHLMAGGKRLTACLFLAVGLLGIQADLRPDWETRSAHSSPKASAPMADPHVVLAEANRLSWLLNWYEAEPLYVKSEELFKASGDKHNELYARVGRLRAQFDRMSFSEISRALKLVLRSRVTAGDPRLKLWCLMNKGYIDLSINLLSAKADWTEGLRIARSLGENLWAARAAGELGVVAFLEGNTSKAADQVGRAFFTAKQQGDIGAQIRFADMLGTGLNEIHRYSEAIPFFEQAIQLGRRSEE